MADRSNSRSRRYAVISTHPSLLRLTFEVGFSSALSVPFIVVAFSVNPLIQIIKRLRDKDTPTTSDYASKLSTLGTALLFLSDRLWMNRVRELFLLLKFPWYWSQSKRRSYDDEELSQSYPDRNYIVSERSLHVTEKHPPRRRETDEFK